MGGGTAGTGADAHTSWSSAGFDSYSSPNRSYDYPGSIDAAIISEIDLVMRSHADKLLLAIEGLSARLLQLETRTHQLELSVDDLKVSIGNNRGSTDGKMRQTENILLEIQSCMQDLKYKRVHTEKLLMSKITETQETRNISQINPAPEIIPAPQQSTNQQFCVASLQQPSPFSASPCVPPPPQQRDHPLIHLPPQFPPTPAYFTLAAQTQEAYNHQHQLAPPPIYPHQQPAPPPIYRHQQPVAADNFPISQLQPPIVHRSEESRIASQTCLSSFQQF